MRDARIERKTTETQIVLALSLDGEGTTQINTGIGFFDHMLDAFARHALIDLSIVCTGDLHIDCHHTVEDCGIVLGQALRQAMGNRAGIARIGYSYVPMDEALAFCALDLSNRGYLSYEADKACGMIGEYDAQMTEEFFRALAICAGITVHASCTGHNAHHITEALYKAFGRALRCAVQRDERVRGIPSTKGVI